MIISFQVFAVSGSNNEVFVKSLDPRRNATIRYLTQLVLRISEIMFAWAWLHGCPLCLCLLWAPGCVYIYSTAAIAFLMILSH